jgi:cell division protein FtsW
MSATTRPAPRTTATPPRLVVSVKRLFTAESPEYVVMVATILFLVVFGLVMVLSSSFVDSSLSNDGNFFAVFLRQTMWALIGLPLMLIISRMPPITFKRAAPALFLGALALQGLVFTPLGFASGGNTNWVNIAGLTGQPSELLKVAMVIWMAAILSDRVNEMHDYKTLWSPLGIGVILAMGLVVAGKDLGTMGVMLVIALGVVFLAGVRMAHLVVLGGAAFVALGLLAITSPSRVNRMMTWFTGCAPEDYYGSCWQVVHSTYALGSGGIWGVGLGNSRAKWSWLPAAETDFIFAIVGEELGLIGAIIVLLAFVVLAVAMTRIARSQADPFARLLTGGVMVWLIGQALVNIAVVLELLPVLGVPLPFMSVGGSALLASLVAVGAVMAVNRNTATSVTDFHAKRRAVRS